jgi:hypothetical protein
MLKITETASKLALIILGLLTISSCATNSQPAQISEINANRESYLRKNFSPENLPIKVSKNLPNTSGNTTLPFQLITIQQKTETVNNDGKKTACDSTTKIYNVGKGLTQSMRATSINDIPLEYSFDTAYRNTYLLSYQSASQSKKYANAINQAKEIKKLDELPQKLDEKHTYTFDVVMISKFSGKTYTNKSECKTDKYYPASTLNKNIEGLAINLQCGIYSNSILLGFDNLVYLERYGITIHSGKKNTTGNTVKTIQNFIVE